MKNKKNNNIKIYFVGIGGIGMSGIAELMHEIGYTVIGSDKTESENVKRLKKIGIKIFIGHNKNNIKKVNAVVFSSAISDKNSEIKEAKKNSNLKVLISNRYQIVGETDVCHAKC